MLASGRVYLLGFPIKKELSLYTTEPGLLFLRTRELLEA